MKKTFTTAALILALFVFASPSQILASGDTLDVYSSLYSLDEIINNDTTASGLQAHSVYRLVSLDTTYIYLGPVTVKSNISVIGVLGEDGRPPCIQPGVLSDGSLPFWLFVLNGDNTQSEFKNLYITGMSVNGTINQLNVNGVGGIIVLNGESSRVLVDNVIFEDWPENAIAYYGDYSSIFVYNSVFRNMISATQWYSGEAVRNGDNQAITDTIVMKNNTIFAINAYAACPVTAKYIDYFDFSNNNVMMTFQNPFWIFNVTNGKVNNNIFYATWAGGITKDEYNGWWNQLWSKEIGSQIDLDTLDLVKAKYWLPADSADANIRWIAEAKRKIEVKNNLYYQPTAVTDFWTNWNATQPNEDSIYTPTWMDERTLGMFADKEHWPGLVEEGNIFVDPGFGSSIDDVLYNDKGNGVGLFQYFEDIRKGAATTNVYGYQLQSVSGDNWIPEWPLPETEAMAYTNPAVLTGATDGGEIGDRNWFHNIVDVEEVETNLPNKIELFDAYPNPFNPTTNIKFNLASSGKVSLKVYNVMGQLITTVVDNDNLNQGTHEYKLAMSNFSSGIYFYTLTSGDVQITRKMVLMK